MRTDGQGNHDRHEYLIRNPGGVHAPDQGRINARSSQLLVVSHSPAYMHSISIHDRVTW